jgi:ATP-dependent Lon protease
MLLDELDKVNGDSRYNPLGCLFTLLEKKAAQEFIDEALEVKMNCSEIIWFASANTVETISSPILSRFTVFHIKDPSYEQQCKIAQSVYSDLLAENVWGQKFVKQLGDDVIEKLFAFSPRKQKAVLIHACGEVAYECESKPKGLLKIQTKHIQLPEKKQKRSIGFL